MPIPSNASQTEPSARVSHNPLDVPNSLVCILDDAVSSGCNIHELTVCVNHRTSALNMR